MLLLSIFLQASSSDINVFAELVKQSPLIACLGVAVKYFYDRQKKLEAAAIVQAEKLEQYMKDDREQLITIVQNNTRVMEEIENYIQKTAK